MNRAGRLLLAICALLPAAGIVLGQPPQADKPAIANAFPVTIQFSPVPSAQNGKDLLLHTEQMKENSINEVIKNGFSNFWIYNFSGDTTKKF